MKKENGYFIWKKNEEDNTLLATFFKAGEFECHCRQCNGEEQRISVELVEKLDAIRAVYGRPVVVTSGFRCHAHQERLREMGFETAKSISQHELGNAVDVGVADVGKFFALASEKFLAIGRGRTWLHLDTRSDKERHWAYKL